MWVKRAPLLLAGTVFLLAAGAQDTTPALSRLEVDLWPEYDRPGVLVIYRATIAPDVTLPAALRFRIPAVAGTPNAVAELQPDGRLIRLAYDRTAAGESATIALVATRPRVQIEYYDPRIERQGGVRSFTYEWPGDYAVGSLVVAAQQPDLARELTTEPPPTGEELGNDGLVYKTVARGAVAAGETAVVTLSYGKVAETLTVETLQPAVDPAAAAAAPVASGGGFSTATARVVVALPVAGVVLVAAVRLRTRRHPVENGGPGHGATRFCTRCGGALEPGDLFCSQCGTAVR